MTTVLHLLAAIGIVFAINLLPAFGPPTWAVLVFVRFQWQDIPPAARSPVARWPRRAVVWSWPSAPVSSADGSLPERRANLEALGQTLAKSKSGVVASLAVFVFSPLPSAQMFMAAGLADIPLLPLAGAFLIGRSVSYTIYVTGATAAQETVNRLLSQGQTSASAIAIQLASLAAVLLMIKIDWIKIIDWTRARIARMRGKPAPPSVRPSEINLTEQRSGRDEEQHSGEARESANPRS